MKRLLKLCLVAAIVIATGCKKEKITQTPDKEVETSKEDTFPEWVSYNTVNSPLPNNQINA